MKKAMLLVLSVIMITLAFAGCATNEAVDKTLTDEEVLTRYCVDHKGVDEADSMEFEFDSDDDGWVWVSTYDGDGYQTSFLGVRLWYARQIVENGID